VIQSDTALDPEFPQQWLELSGAKITARLDATATSELMHDARILLASLVNGAADGALEASALYMANRVQFGRPLSAKQAVRHWLARMKLVQEVSAAAIQRALATNEYGQARAAHAALAGAITHAVFVLEKAIHLHGGMGFTWEVPLHYSLREVRKLDAAFGAGSLARDLGRSFIEMA
jgi:alkylation response protein AidB-like acyl-CoA dehydrogenase